eukprot:TRINITY_DN4084_c0_g1_i2.p1 TRINITY_DN4084_c0_g1~~TRINITY_DN4084_c0_g1_i2.p1  ORF type:complete len:133 (-),score=20.89 TRINITY_DN4084_c0_g1_i2:15-413(-)
MANKRKVSPVANDESNAAIRYKRNLKENFENCTKDEKNFDKEGQDSLSGVWDRIGRDMLPIVLKFVFEIRDEAKESWRNLRGVNREWKKVADSVFPFVQHEAMRHAIERGASISFEFLLGLAAGVLKVSNMI